MAKRGLVVGCLLLIGFSIGWFSRKAPGGFPILEPVKIINPKPVSEIKPKIIWKDTVIYRDTGSYRIAVIHDSIPVLVPIDTEAIVADYLLERKYTIDTTTKNIHAVINMNVFANKLVLFDAQFDYYQPKPGLELKYGVMVGRNQITPLLQIEKGKFSVTAGYSFGNNNGIKAGILYQY